MFSLAVDSQGDVLAMGNPSKERDTWKEKCEALDQKLTKFQEETSAIREKVCCIEAFQEEAKIHDSPSTFGFQKKEALPGDIRFYYKGKQSH